MSVLKPGKTNEPSQFHDSTSPFDFGADATPRSGHANATVLILTLVKLAQCAADVVGWAWC